MTEFAIDRRRSRAREGLIFMFSTKRLGLLFAAVLIGTMSLGIVTSGAWFTDTDTVGVTATSGRIDIDAQNLEPFTVSNVLPGVWTSTYDMDVYNTSNSTTAVKYRITDSYTGGNPSFFNQLLVRVRHTHCVTGADRSTWPIVFEGALSDLNWTSASSSVSTTLNVNTSHCYAFQFALPSATGNAYQNLSTTFNLVVDATQPENPGWSESGS
jgi:predicted ribosomally synthesized peptide with SipW-like signal peptide